MKKSLGLIILLMLAVFTANAQDLVVTGRVTSSSDGLPIPGVSVVQKGTTIGTISDIDGNYSLSTQLNETLVFSFVGLKSREIVVTGSSINVEMVESWTGLDEVVVVGYGVQKKALVTGANVNVKGDKISELNTGNAMEALQGLAAGVNITRKSGEPGAGTKVTIRGAGTIGNANPLYIVDGVSVEDINYLNPSDIESVDVLKDAASAAIYGSRAANGVILVTTKKGVKGVGAKISYDGYYGVQNIYKTLPALNAQEYMYIMDESRSNQGSAPFDWENLVVNGNTYLNTTFVGNLGDEYGQYAWDKIQSGWKGTNWIDEITNKNAPVQSHAINITGASDDVVYSAGFSYYDQDGLLGGHITDAGYKRITARLNTEFVLKKNDSHNILTIGENFSYTNTENRSVAAGNIYWNDLHDALVANPIMPVYWEQEDIQHWTGGYGPTLEGVAKDQNNPVGQMYYRHNNNWGKGNKIVGNVYAVLEPIKDLKIRSSFGIDSWFGQNRSWAPTFKLSALYSNSTDAAEQSMYQGVNYTWTNTATYDFSIEEHKISVLAGTEMLKNVLNANIGGRKINTLFG